SPHYPRTSYTACFPLSLHDALPISVIGVLRLPDIYTRSHAATKSVTFGVLCTLTGVFLYLWLIEGDFNIKLLLGISFLLFTAPIGGHLMARAAYLSGVEPDE